MNSDIKMMALHQLELQTDTQFVANEILVADAEACLSTQSDKLESGFQAPST